MSTKISSDPTHEAVSEYYAERAKTSQSCCEPEVRFYDSNEVESLPSDIASFSLGCGNAVGMADLNPGETVLDLGSGGGLECFIAAKEVGEKGYVIGLDMTDDMLNRARAAASRMGLDQVEFRKGLIEKMPVEDESIDVVLSNCVINLSPDKPAVLHEIWRVLKPGGRIAITDIVTNKPVPDHLRKDMALWSACASGAMTTSEWEQGLAALGFQNISISPVDFDEEYDDMIPESQPYSALVKAVKAA